MEVGINCSWEQTWKTENKCNKYMRKCSKVRRTSVPGVKKGHRELSCKSSSPPQLWRWHVDTWLPIDMVNWGPIRAALWQPVEARLSELYIHSTLLQHIRGTEQEEEIEREWNMDGEVGMQQKVNHIVGRLKKSVKYRLEQPEEEQREREQLKGW